MLCIRLSFAGEAARERTPASLRAGWKTSISAVMGDAEVDTLMFEYKILVEQFFLQCSGSLVSKCDHISCIVMVTLHCIWTFLVLIATAAYLELNKESSTFEQWHCLPKKTYIMANRMGIPLSLGDQTKRSPFDRP